MPPPFNLPALTIGRTPPDSEPVVVITEEWSSPQRTHRGSAKPPAHLAAPRRKKKGNLLLWIFFALTLIVIAIAVCGFTIAHSTGRPLRGRKDFPASGEEFLGAPVRASEEQFFVAAPAESTKGASPPCASRPKSGLRPVRRRQREGRSPKRGTEADRAKPSGGSRLPTGSRESRTAEPSASGRPFSLHNSPRGAAAAGREARGHRRTTHLSSVEKEHTSSSFKAEVLIHQLRDGIEDRSLSAFRSTPPANLLNCHDEMHQRSAHRSGVGSRSIIRISRPKWPADRWLPG